MIVDLFAGPGGWDEGLATLGIHDVVGIEWDLSACQTATAAGHARLHADVAAYPTARFVGKTTGLIASPPCQAFSLAGKGGGTKAIDRLLAHVYACRDGWVQPDADLCTDDLRADLTMQPLRWVHDLRPEWIALEQVPGVLPLWEAMAHVFRGWGYDATTAILCAADYGVPQTRRRAILVASRASSVSMPEATHFDPRMGMSLFGESWVSMASALGWDAGVVVDRRQTGAPVVSADDAPAPTVTTAAFGAGVWTLTRPATTVIGADTIAAPGHRCMSDDCCGKGPRRHMDERSIKVTEAQAGVLQSFRPDYPWQGTKTKRFQQIGNAIPPVLAAAVVRQFVPVEDAAAGAA